SEKVRATQGGFDRVLWEWPKNQGMWEWLKPKSEWRIVSIQPAVHEHGPLVQVASVLGAVHGLDGRTGQPVWQCKGFGDYLGFLRTDDSRALPRVVSWSNDATVCSLAIPLLSGGELQPTGQPVFESRQDDPRLLQPLPWSSVSEKLRLPRQLLFSAAVVL